MLDAITPHPLTGDRFFLAVFVVEFDCDPIILETEELLSQSIIVLPFPLFNQKRPYLRMTVEKTGPVAPDRVLCVRLEAEKSQSFVPGSNEASLTLSPGRAYSTNFAPF